jgi:hypothetical protein
MSSDNPTGSRRLLDHPAPLGSDPAPAEKYSVEGSGAAQVPTLAPAEAQSYHAVVPLPSREETSNVASREPVQKLRSTSPRR